LRGVKSRRWKGRGWKMDASRDTEPQVRESETKI